jgi:hypothetical protein
MLSGFVLGLRSPGAPLQDIAAVITSLPRCTSSHRTQEFRDGLLPGQGHFASCHGRGLPDLKPYHDAWLTLLQVNTVFVNVPDMVPV